MGILFLNLKGTCRVKYFELAQPKTLECLWHNSRLLIVFPQIELAIGPKHCIHLKFGLGLRTCN